LPILKTKFLSAIFIVISFAFLCAFISFLGILIKFYIPLYFTDFCYLITREQNFPLGFNFIFYSSSKSLSSYKAATYLKESYENITNWINRIILIFFLSMFWIIFMFTKKMREQYIFSFCCWIKNKILFILGYYCFICKCN